MSAVSQQAGEAIDAELKVGEYPQDHRTELRLWLRLLTCANMIEATIRKRLRDEFDTTLPRFDLMAQLQRSTEGMLLGELSKRMMVSNGNITGLVERLVDEGLVERQVSDADRRAVFVRLSTKGNASFATMAAAHSEWISELMHGLETTQQHELLSTLGHLKSSIVSSTASRAEP